MSDQDTRWDLESVGGRWFREWELRRQDHSFGWFTPLAISFSFKGKAMWCRIELGIWDLHFGFYKNHQMQIQIQQVAEGREVCSYRPSDAIEGCNCYICWTCRNRYTEEGEKREA
jgi:hypothetical protein